MARVLTFMAFALLMCACQGQNVHRNVFGTPIYSGHVTPVNSPVTLVVAPLNTRATFNSETHTIASAGQKSATSKSGAAGYVESYRLGPAVQVRIVLNKLDAGRGLLSAPDLIVQINYSDNGAVNDLSVGGPLVASASVDERRQLDVLAQELPRMLAAATTKSQLHQGETAFSFRMSDILRKYDTQAIYADMKADGPGFAARLVGQTVRQGRHSYVMAVDGSENVRIPSEEFSISMSGFYIVDAATGLFAENNLLSVIVGQRQGQKFEKRDLQTSSLKF